MREVKIIISQDGSNVSTEVNGVSGSGCIDTTKDVLAALGQEVKQVEKDAYYEGDSQSVEQF